MGSSTADLVAIETFDAGIVVRFLTDSLLDPIPVEAIGHELQASLEASAAPNVVVVLRNISALGSLMLSVLIALREEASARGGEVCLAAIPDRVDYLLKLTKLENQFPHYASAEEALADLG